MRAFTVFLKKEDGVAAIEAAFVLPILFAIVFGGIEFGTYFLKAQTNASNIAAASHAVQQDPGDPSNIELLSGAGLLSAEERVSCAKSFLSLEAARNGNCVNGQWDTLKPSNMPDDQTAYFVLIRSGASEVSITGLFDEIVPDIDSRQVVKLSVRNDALTCNGVPEYGQLCVEFTFDDEQYEGREQTTTPLGKPYCSQSGWSCDVYRVVTSSHARGVENTPTLVNRCSPRSVWNNYSSSGLGGGQLLNRAGLPDGC